MSVFEELTQDYVRAVSEGKLREFCQRLEDELMHAPQSVNHWRMLARAREAQGNVDAAESCYQQAVQLAYADHPKTAHLLREVNTFAERHRRARVVADGDRVPSAADETSPSPTIAPISRPRRSRPSGPIGGPPPARPQSAPRGPQALEPTDVPSFRGTVKAEDVKPKLAEVERAYQAGDRRPEMFLCFGRLLQQDGQLERALTILKEGLSLHPGEHNLSLLNAHTQILSALGRWPDAAKGYERLARSETRPGARRFYQMQLALMYRRDGEIEAAREVLDGILHDDPRDLVVSRLRRSLEQPDENVSVADVPDNEADDDSPGLYISRLFTCDLEKAEFRDGEILAKGGKPDLADAKRLMNRAESLKKSSPFAVRYPLFQEAAKAFTRLAPDTWDPIDFLWAVARYALVKGGALVLDFRGKLSQGADLDTLRRLRDSITSYSLETVDVLLRLDIGQRRGQRLTGRRAYAPQAGYVFTALTNHLWTHLAFAHSAGTAMERPDSSERDFLQLFKMCLAQPQPDLRRVAYESLVGCGALNSQFLPWLGRVPDGRCIIELVQAVHPDLQQRRAVLAELAGRSPQRDDSPWDLLNQAIHLWAEARKVIDEFFSHLERPKLTPATLVEIQDQWRRFPRDQRSLLSTDLELVDGVQAALANLAGYVTRSGEERTMRLSLFRAELDRLLRVIEGAPTYWGRVRFEPLLRRWLGAVSNLERLRLEELMPRLEIVLEPPVFWEDGDEVVGCVRVRNSGHGTADGFSVNFQMREPGNPDALWRGVPIRRTELPVGASCQVECRVPRKAFRAGLESPYTLDAAVQLSGTADTGDELHEAFTLEIDRGGGFTRDDVPWNEVPIPGANLFKGRQQELDELERHLRSTERNHTPLLVGLTRTGKSTLLKYLNDRLHLNPTGHPGEPTRFLCVMWDFGEAAGLTEQRYLWRYLLRGNKDDLVVKIETLRERGELPTTFALPGMVETEVGPQDWRPLVLSLRSANLYPVFLVDEFTYYRTLADKKLVGPAFLAAMRSFAIEGLASFVFAGTYELRQMVRDPAYGVTGQLANVLERRVSSIDEASAGELVRAMEPRLRFTDEATRYLFRLSFRIPCFIQLMCKNAAWVAAAASRGWVGYPDLERVVRVLAGESALELPGGVQRLSPGIFQKNMYFPDDPVTHLALLSTICSLSYNQQQPDIPRPVSHDAILNQWREHGVPGAERKAAEALGELKERQVLVEADDDGHPSYTISVDLFRRWWRSHHRYLKPELDLLKE